MPLHAFESHVAREWSPDHWIARRLILAVSGGADSVALLRALTAIARSQLPGPTKTIIVAHFHHGWRGHSADADQQFVESLAKAENLQFATARSSGTHQTGGIGREATGRRERYAFLLDTAQRFGARYIGTAHTANDQVETILHRILRGTGIEGLTGIPRVRRLKEDVALVRPLLGRTRAEIEGYLTDLGQTFRRDESNFDQTYMRNRIRHQLLPELRASFQPHLDNAILSLADDAREHVEAVRQEMATHYDEIVSTVDGAVQIRRAAFQSLTPLRQRLLLREVWRQNHWPQQNMSRPRWHELASFASMGPLSRKHFPGGILLANEGDLVRIQKRD